MRMRARSESGESLIEIIIAIVVIGIVVGSFFSAIATTSAASTGHRDLVTADGILRDYAEATKSAVRDQTNGCGNAGNSNFTVNYTPTDSRFAVSSSPSLTNQSCPSKTLPRVEHLQVVWGGGQCTSPVNRCKKLDVEVRTP